MHLLVGIFLEQRVQQCVMNDRPHRKSLCVASKDHFANVVWQVSQGGGRKLNGRMRDSFFKDRKQGLTPR
jgi:hypothetical protein